MNITVSSPKVDKICSFYFAPTIGPFNVTANDCGLRGLDLCRVKSFN